MMTVAARLAASNATSRRTYEATVTTYGGVYTASLLDVTGAVYTVRHYEGRSLEGNVCRDPRIQG